MSYDLKFIFIIVVVIVVIIIMKTRKGNGWKQKNRKMK